LRNKLFAGAYENE